MLAFRYRTCRMGFFFFRRWAVRFASFILVIVIRYAPKQVANKAIETAKTWAERPASDRKMIGLEVQPAIAKRLGLKPCLYCDEVLYPGEPHEECDRQLDAEMDVLDGDEPNWPEEWPCRQCRAVTPNEKLLKGTARLAGVRSRRNWPPIPPTGRFGGMRCPRPKTSPMSVPSAG